MKKTLEQRVQEMKGDIAKTGARTIVDDNVIDIETLVKETIRLEDAVFKFKGGLLQEGVLEEVLSTIDEVGTTNQLLQGISVLVRCMPQLDKFDELMSTFIPAVATMSAILIKKKELAELAEAIS